MCTMDTDQMILNNTKPNQTLTKPNHLIIKWNLQVISQFWDNLRMGHNFYRELHECAWHHCWGWSNFYNSWYHNCMRVGGIWPFLECCKSIQVYPKNFKYSDERIYGFYVEQVDNPTSLWLCPWQKLWYKNNNDTKRK